MDKPRQTTDETIVKEFQSELSKKIRFFRNSNPDRFYIETHDGALLMPNEFCTFKEGRVVDSYFLFSRIGNELFTSYSIKVGKGVCLFEMSSGLIYLKNELISSHIYPNAEFIDFQKAKEDLQKAVKAIFSQFTITF